MGALSIADYPSGFAAASGLFAGCIINFGKHNRKARHALARLQLGFVDNRSFAGSRLDSPGDRILVGRE